MTRKSNNILSNQENLRKPKKSPNILVLRVIKDEIKWRA